MMNRQKLMTFQTAIQGYGQAMTKIVRGSRKTSAVKRANKQWMLRRKRLEREMHEEARKQHEQMLIDREEAQRYEWHG